MANEATAVAKHNATMASLQQATLTEDAECRRLVGLALDIEKSRLRS